MLTPAIIGTFQGLAERCLKNGLISASEVPELSRALIALEFERKLFEDHQQKLKTDPKLAVIPQE